MSIYTKANEISSAQIKEMNEIMAAEIKEMQECMDRVLDFVPGRAMASGNREWVYIEKNAWAELQDKDEGTIVLKDGPDGESQEIFIPLQEDLEVIKNSRWCKIVTVPIKTCSLADTDTYPLNPLGNVKCLMKHHPEVVTSYHFTKNGERYKSVENKKGGGIVVCDFSKKKGIDCGYLLCDCTVFAKELERICAKVPLPHKKDVSAETYSWALGVKKALESRRNAFSADNTVAQISDMFRTQRDNILSYVDKTVVNETRKGLTPKEFDDYLLTLNMRKVWGHLVNCQNGVLNLHTGEFRRHTVLDMCTQMCNADYIPGAQCPEGLQFVTDLMDGNKDRLLLLQMTLGAALSGAKIDHVKAMPLFYGPFGHNGKSTLIQVLIIVFGSSTDEAAPGYVAQAGLSLLLPTKDKSKSLTPELFMCTSSAARFVAISEPNRNEQIDPGKLKSITGNTTHAVEGKHKDATTGEWLGTMFLDCNNVPIIDDPVVYSSGRLPIIPFEVSFLDDNDKDAVRRRKLGAPVKPRRDDLDQLFNSDEFRNWFLAWVVEGYQKWVANGRKFHTWEGQTDEEDRCRKRSDKVYAYMSETYEETEDKKDIVTLKSAYEGYQEWAGYNNCGILNYRNFEQALIGNGYPTEVVGHQDVLRFLRKKDIFGLSKEQRIDMCPYSIQDIKDALKETAYGLTPTTKTCEVLGTLLKVKGISESIFDILLDDVSAYNPPIEGLPFGGTEDDQSTID